MVFPAGRQHLDPAKIEAIVKDARTRMPEFILKRAVSLAVDYVYGKKGEEHAAYYGAALSRIEREDKEAREAKEVDLAVEKENEEELARIRDEERVAAELARLTNPKHVELVDPEEDDDEPGMLREGHHPHL